MRNFLESAGPSGTALLILSAVCVLLLAGVVALLTAVIRSNSRLCRRLREESRELQASLLEKAPELLASRLAAYTEDVLSQKVTRQYETLIGRDLIPAVKQAVRQTAELGETLRAGQEEGMRRLAEQLIAGMSEELDKYLDAEVHMVAAVHENVDAFSEELRAVTEGIRQASAAQAETAAAAQAVLESFARSQALLSESSNALADRTAMVAEAVESIRRFAQQTSRNTEAMEAAAAPFSNSADAMHALAAQLKEASGRFAEEADRLNTGFNSGLKESAEQLSSIFGTQKAGLDEASHRFHDEMERSISDALRLMDESLADILGRIAEVAADLRAAADVSPDTAGPLK